MKPFIQRKLITLFFIFSGLAFALNAQVNYLPVSIEQDTKNQKVNVNIGGEYVTSYCYMDKLKKPVLFPLKSPENNIITRGWPMKPREGERTDHPHQMGVWLNYGDVDGIDFWNNSYKLSKKEQADYGHIDHKEILSIQGGPAKGLLKTRTHWLGPDNTLLLKENIRYIFRGTEDRYIIDRMSTFSAELPIDFGDNKEGLFAIRVARELETPDKQPVILTDKTGKPSKEPVIDTVVPNGHYHAANGLEGLDVWGSENPWVSLTGEINGEQVTIAIFDHPKNPGHPPAWHTRKYGLFALNNFGSKVYNQENEAFVLKLEPGESYIFHHRIIIFSGQAPDNNSLFKAYRAFQLKYDE